MINVALSCRILVNNKECRLAQVKVNQGHQTVYFLCNFLLTLFFSICNINQAVTRCQHVGLFMDLT